MDQIGFGPQCTPSRLAGRWPTVDLLAYQDPTAGPPALLLVPAPIKAAYIWDLAPAVSVVKRCRDAGMQVYLMRWRRPEGGDESWGIAEYADRAIRECMDTAAKEIGQRRVFLVGHSLGETLAAIQASLYSERLHGLIALEAPIAFDANAGSLEAAVAHAPPAAAVTERIGNVPGTLLDWLSVWADPNAFNVEPWLDWLESTRSLEYAQLYARVRRWTFDEAPMPRQLFEEVLEQLYRRNRFVARTLRVGERLADPMALTAPVFAVADPRSRLVPPFAFEAYRTRTATRDVQIVPYSGDVGVMLRHVGVLVGRNAHASLWPRALRWVREHFRPEARTG